MSHAEDVAPAFRDALSAASESEARGLLRGSDCPEPMKNPLRGEYDAIHLVEEDQLVVFRTGNDRAWVQSDRFTDLESMR
jgi:hypothetical protein